MYGDDVKQGSTAGSKWGLYLLFPLHTIGNRIMKSAISLILFCVVSVSAQAKEIIYQGKVEGMVCAFCVYSVSKKIAQLPQVDAQTVNVDLKSKTVNFRSTASVSFKTLSALFADTGFKLTELNEVQQATLKTIVYQSKPVLRFKLENLDIEQYEAILASIGDVAASTRGKLIITAPASVEIALLKPMIGGKQKIARVQYQTGKNQTTIEITLLLRAE